MVPQSTRLKSMLNAQLIVKRSFLFAPRSLTNAAEAKGLSEMGEWQRERRNRGAPININWVSIGVVVRRDVEFPTKVPVQWKTKIRKPQSYKFSSFCGCLWQPRNDEEGVKKLDGLSFLFLLSASVTAIRPFRFLLCYVCVHRSETFKVDCLVSGPVIQSWRLWCMAGYLNEWSWFIDFRDIYAKRHFFIWLMDECTRRPGLKWYFEIINKSHFRIYIFFFNMINNWMNNACFFTIFI